MIAAHADSRSLKKLIEGYLSGMVHRTTDRRSEFDRLMDGAQVGIVGTLDCTTQLVQSLKSTFRFDMASGPSCIVVTRVAFDNLRNLRDIEGDRLHVVWVEEIEERLPEVLDRVMRAAAARSANPQVLETGVRAAEAETRLRELLDKLVQVADAEKHLGKLLDDIVQMAEAEERRRNVPDDPLRAWGRKMLDTRPLSSTVASAVELVCGIPHDTSPPVNSVAALAKQVAVDTRELGDRWAAEIPLGCTLKQLLSWGILLWAIRHREDGSWNGVARAVGITQPTLRRYSLKFARCNLAAAADNPALVRRRFDEWLSGVAVD